MSPFDRVRRRSSLSIRRAEQELPLSNWVRRATALGPLARRPHRSSAAACGWSSPSTASPRGGECLRSTILTDGRRCLFAGLSRSCRFRTGSAGPLRWGRWPAALAVPLPLPAGGRRRALPAPGGGSVSVRPRTPTVVAGGATSAWAVFYVCLIRIRQPRPTRPVGSV